MKQTTMKIRAYTASDRKAGVYAVFGEGRLFLTHTGSAELHEVAHLETIREIDDNPDSRREGE